MALMYNLTVYCSDCSTDFAESDSDDFDELVQKMEARAEYLYQEHLRNGECR